VSDWPLILCYHHIDRRESSRYVMSASGLERQLTRLLDAGFSAIPLSEAVRTGPFGDSTAPAGTFTVTFDDGFESFSTLAAPILRRLGLLGCTTAFLPTGFVGAENDWREEPSVFERLRRRGDPPAPLMSWDVISQLAEEGVGMESHGDRHLRMNELSYEDAFADASASKTRLAAHGIDSRFLALPYGWRSTPCKRALSDAGFEASFTVMGGGSDRYEIRRVPLYGTDDLLTQRLKLSGNYFGLFETAARLAGRRRAPHG